MKRSTGARQALGGQAGVAGIVLNYPFALELVEGLHFLLPPAEKTVLRQAQDERSE